MKDIFIDNNIASRYLSNPTEEEYLNLIDWLDTSSDLKENDAHLVVSRHLITEYHESNRNPKSRTNIIWILDRMTKRNRINPISNSQIDTFQKQHFTKKILKRLLSNSKDRNHIPAVLLSDRKMTLSEDNNFLNDLYQFSGFNPITARRPENLNYSGEEEVENIEEV